MFEQYFKDREEKKRATAYSNGYGWAMSAYFIEGKTFDYFEAMIHGSTDAFDKGAGDAVLKISEFENAAQYGRLINVAIKGGEYIKLTPHEIQSSSTRQHWAQGLIKQLPLTHEGRCSWLLNYGTIEESKIARAKKDILFLTEYQAAETVSQQKARRDG